MVGYVRRTRNTLFDYDEPVMHEILDALPAGTVLDAACGTCRYAAYLAGRGHRIIGVDSSPDMLVRARARADLRFKETPMSTMPRLPLNNGVTMPALGLSSAASDMPKCFTVPAVIRSLTAPAMSSIGIPRLGRVHDE